MNEFLLSTPLLVLLLLHGGGGGSRKGSARPRLGLWLPSGLPLVASDARHDAQGEGDERRRRATINQDSGFN